MSIKLNKLITIAVFILVKVIVKVAIPKSETMITMNLNEANKSILIVLFQKERQIMLKLLHICHIVNNYIQIT